jgi:hypothetical protein
MVQNDGTDRIEHQSSIVPGLCGERHTHFRYTMTITDPATFAEPLELKRAWVWRPDEAVKPYNGVKADRSQR